MPSERKYFADQSNGLNADDSDFAIPLNEVVNMQDCRIGSTDKGVTGTVESVGGTLLLSTPSPSVTFIELGNTPDIVGNRIIYAYYNVNTSQHKIEVYDKTAGVIYLALLSSQVTGGLIFNKNYLIHGRVINGIWYFTDNLNSPRKLNIDAAIKMNNPSYVTTETAYTNPLEASVISLIRKPPVYPLTATKQTDGTVLVNNVSDFSGFFAWRYTFVDDEESVLSTPSVLINYNAVGDLGNVVRLVATDATGSPQQIPQDVQVVDFCVKYAGTSNYFIIKSWDKRIASQAADIVANNAGTPLSFTFKNDITGIALDAAYSVKPYDSVPLVSETIETGLNRLFLGNNLEAYNTPVLTSLTGVLISDTVRPFQNPIFHSESPYQIGIIFRDEYKRVIGNVVTRDSLRFQIPIRDYIYTTYYKFIQWTLSNAAAADEIPIDAATYDIVITKNLKTRFFVQSKSGGMKYAIKNPVTSLITYQDTYSTSAYGLAFDASILNAEGLGYSFQDGDIINIIQSASATQYSLAVIAQDGNYIISKLQDLGSFTTQPDIIFEIYTPYFEAINEPFWTIGKSYAINNPGTISRTYSVISANIQGDVYTYQYVAPTGPFNAEHMAPIPKYWKEWNVNAGEVEIVQNSKQLRKVTAVRWSNTIIEGAQTNGLSTFDALDERILPLNLKVLRKLQQTSKVSEQGNIMLAIGEGATASLYLGEVQVVGADQNAFLASAPNVIGTVNVLKGDFGTTMPSTVLEYRGIVIWYDLNAGRIIQYASNGLFPISNYKMTRFWKQWAIKFQSMTTAQIEAFGDRPFVFTIVDSAHDEVLFSLPKLSNEPPKGYLPSYPTAYPPANEAIIFPWDILDFQGKTVVYDLKYSRWRGSFSFVAEGFSSLQNQLYAFKSGQMYLHNQQNQCQYYGVQYKPKVMCISNMEPTLPKSYNSIAVRSNIIPLLTVFYNLYPYQQLSDLFDIDYRDVEGVWYANVKRNILQPTAIGYTATSLLTGEKMRNVAMMVMLEFSVNTVPLELKFVDFNFSISLGHNPKNSQ